MKFQSIRKRSIHLVVSMVVPFAGHLTLSLPMNRVGRDSVEPPFLSIGELDGVSPHRSWSQCAANFGIPEGERKTLPAPHENPVFPPCKKMAEDSPSPRGRGPG